MYIDDSGGGGAVDFGAIGASMKSFAKAAVSGAFAINPDTGGQALLNAITHMQNSLTEREGDFDLMALEPQLGTSHGAHTMRQFVPQVATDGQGFLTMLTKFKESLADAKTGIEAAIANYQDLEERGSGNMR
jgi:hypothetical protein